MRVFCTSISADVVTNRAMHTPAQVDGHPTVLPETILGMRGRWTLRV